MYTVGLEERKRSAYISGFIIHVHSGFGGEKKISIHIRVYNSCIQWIWRREKRLEIPVSSENETKKKKKKKREKKIDMLGFSYRILT